jgi:pimeloyl-ACP methyl ester carboxylesterase
LSICDCAFDDIISATALKTPQEVFMKFETRQFEMNDGVIIVADAYGDPEGQPVLFAHGGGQTRHAWGKTAQVLAAQGHYAVAYDHRGHGDSGWSPNGIYHLEQFASDQRTIAEQLSQPPVMVGASLGGLSAMLAQGESTDEVYSALIFVDIAPKMNQSGAMNILGFMSEHITEGFATLDEAADIIATYTGRPRRDDLSGLAKNLRQREGRYYWHWDPNFLTLKMDAQGSPTRLIDATKKIRQPILLVRGRMSDLVTEEIAQEFLQMVPHAEYVDVENARHMVAGDRNDIFTQAVVEFIERLPA